ncbi:MAG: hypothetical protein HW383_594 [Candidatus Magasanikbacteria bacterium]|nr:hypothetical protein [Candidatus Magasanikbacteria bacterium]
MAGVRRAPPARVNVRRIEVRVPGENLVRGHGVRKRISTVIRAVVVDAAGVVFPAERATINCRFRSVRESTDAAVPLNQEGARTEARDRVVDRDVGLPTALVGSAAADPARARFADRARNGIVASSAIGHVRTGTNSRDTRVRRAVIGVVALRGR